MKKSCCTCGTLFGAVFWRSLPKDDVNFEVMTTTRAHCRNLSFCAFTYIKTVHSNKMKEHLAHSLHRDKHRIIAKHLKHFKVQGDLFVAAAVVLVSFAAVIRVVTQCSSPLTAAHPSSAFLSLNWSIRSRLPFLGNLDLWRQMEPEIWLVQLLTVTCMLLVLSNKGKGMKSLSEQPLVRRSVTWWP